MKKSKKKVHEKALDNSFDLNAAELVQLYINKKVNKVEGKLKKSVNGHRHILVNAIQSLLFNNRKTVKHYKSYEQKNVIKTF